MSAILTPSKQEVKDVIAGKIGEKKEKEREDKEDSHQHSQNQDAQSYRSPGVSVSNGTVFAGCKTVVCSACLTVCAFSLWFYLESITSPVFESDAENFGLLVICKTGVAVAGVAFSAFVAYTFSRWLP